MAGNQSEMSWPEANARRLQRHGLSAPIPGHQPADVVAAMCGAHAQVMSAAEVSVALRMESATRTDVRRAIWTEQALVKTYGPRGTVHLLPAQDLPMWCGALAAIPSPRYSFSEGVRLNREQVDVVVGAIDDALQGSELTIDELGDAVVARTGPWAGDLVMPAFNGMWPRWRQAIGTAANRGTLCFGPNRGRKITYTSPRRMLPDFSLQEPRAALAALVGHYLRAYGPATPASFAGWLSAPVRWAAELFESLAGAIETVSFEGDGAWVNAGDTSLATLAVPEVLLLPYFDAFLVGSHPRERLYPGRASERALANGQAGNFPVLLVDGVVAGVWHQRRSGSWIDITVEPLNDLTARQRRALDEQVERIGVILEGKPRLTIGPVAVGPHA